MVPLVQLSCRPFAAASGGLGEAAGWCGKSTLQGVPPSEDSPSAMSAASANAARRAVARKADIGGG